MARVIRARSRPRTSRRLMMVQLVRTSSVELTSPGILKFRESPRRNHFPDTRRQGTATTSIDLADFLNRLDSIRTEHLEPQILLLWGRISALMVNIASDLRPCRSRPLPRHRGSGYQPPALPQRHLPSDSAKRAGPPSWTIQPTTTAVSICHSRAWVISEGRLPRGA